MMDQPMMTEQVSEFTNGPHVADCKRNHRNPDDRVTAKAKEQERVLVLRLSRAGKRQAEICRDTGISTGNIQRILARDKAEIDELAAEYPGTELAVLYWIQANKYPQRKQSADKKNEWQAILPWLADQKGKKVNRSAKNREIARFRNGGNLPEEQVNVLAKKNEKLKEDIKVTNVLLKVADVETSTKDVEIASLKEQVFALNHQLLTLGQQADFVGAVVSCPDSLRDFLEISLSKRGNLTLILTHLETFYSDRVMILDSAYRAAKESDDVNFENIEKAAELLFRLTGKYVDCMRENPQASMGFNVFGNKNYAPNEGERGSGTAQKAKRIRRNRTFPDSNGVEMLEHLKIDNGESVSRTLRIHFKYNNDTKKVVIGHCGRHLN